MHERDLRGIGRAVEHALAEENPAEAHAIEAADERAGVPAFDGMDVAGVEQGAIEPCGCGR